MRIRYPQVVGLTIVTHAPHPPPRPPRFFYNAKSDVFVGVKKIEIKGAVLSMAYQSSAYLVVKMARCVFVGRIQNIRETELAVYFSQYGAIESTNIPLNVPNRCAFVVFKDPESVTRVLQKEEHLIPSVNGEKKVKGKQQSK